MVVVPNKPVVIKIFKDGVQVGSSIPGTTDSNGQVRVDYVPIVGGNYEARAEFAGDGYYQASGNFAPFAFQADTMPGAPTSFTAVVGVGQAQLAWSAPTSDGGSIITAYRVYQNGVRLTPDLGPAVFSKLVTGLVEDTDYAFHVSAVNAQGEGAPSTELVVHTPIVKDVTAIAITAVPTYSSTVGDYVRITLTLSATPAG